MRVGREKDAELRTSIRVELFAPDWYWKCRSNWVWRRPAMKRLRVNSGLPIIITYPCCYCTYLYAAMITRLLMHFMVLLSIFIEPLQLENRLAIMDDQQSRLPFRPAVQCINSDASHATHQRIDTDYHKIHWANLHVPYVHIGDNIIDI